MVLVHPFSAKEALFASALAVLLPQRPLDSAMNFEPRSRRDPSAVANAEGSPPACSTRIGHAAPQSQNVIVENAKISAQENTEE